MDRTEIAAIPFIDLTPVHSALGADAVATFARILGRNDFILGEDVRLFEEEFAHAHGAAHGVGVSSGTAALELILRALGIGPGDEVITTPFTFYATAAAVIFVGATPRFVDVDPATLNLDPAKIEAACTARTRAILPVHLFGQPADMEAIGAIARRRGLAVVEDACQAHGAVVGGRPVGGIGVAAAFSFYPTKNLGGFGDGGMVTTNDAVLAERIRRLRNCGRRGQYEHVELGYNERLDNLQAALLRLKLPRLAGWTAERRRLADAYRAALRGAPLKPLALVAGTEPVYHLFTIRSPERDALRTHLAEHGVAAGVFYPVPLHLQPALAFLGGKEGDLPQAERAAQEVLSLPLYPGFSLDSLARVAQLIRDFFDRAIR